LARDTHTPMGREHALGLEPSRDLEEIRQALAETRQARSALHLSGVPPWELIPDVRPTLESVRVPGSVAEGAELAALIPVLDAACCPFAPKPRAACAASSTTARRAGPRSSSSPRAWWRRTTIWCKRCARRRARRCASWPRSPTPCGPLCPRSWRWLAAWGAS